MTDDQQEVDRTTPVGLYNFAGSYRTAADALSELSLPATHPDAPIVFLYAHAIELYLKALLRGCGRTPDELRDIGHDLAGLRAEAAAVGLDVDDEDAEVIAIMSRPTILKARYIKTGCFRRADLAALRRTGRSLHDIVGRELHRRGEPVRLRVGARRAIDATEGRRAGCPAPVDQA